MKISYIIPAYNEENYIVRCIESVEKQTLKPHEIIVVDNNSKDATAKLAKQHPLVTLLSESQQGMIYARNTGMNYATGEILARIDADTLLFPSWGEQVSNAFSSGPKTLGAVTGPGVFYDINHSRFFSHFQEFFYFGLVRACIHMIPLWGSNMAIRRTVWNEIFPRLSTDDSKVHEDIDITLALRERYSTQFIATLRPLISARRFKNVPSLYEYPKKFISMYYFTQK